MFEFPGGDSFARREIIEEGKEGEEILCLVFAREVEL